MIYNMFCSYEEFMDCNPRVIRTYKNPEKGCVYLTRNCEFCGVTTIEYDDYNNEIVRTRGRMDANVAEDFFDIACRFIRGEIKWCDPVRKFNCKYNPKKSQVCSAEKCPKKLGGAAYHEIFSKSCNFRKARTR